MSEVGKHQIAYKKNDFIYEVYNLWDSFGKCTEKHVLRKLWGEKDNLNDNWGEKETPATFDGKTREEIEEEKREEEERENLPQKNCIPLSNEGDFDPDCDCPFLYEIPDVVYYPRTGPVSRTLLPNALVDYPLCPLTLSFEMVEFEGQVLTNFPILSFNSENQTFDLDFDGDASQVLEYAGNNEEGKDYVVKISAIGPMYERERGWLNS